MQDSAFQDGEDILHKLAWYAQRKPVYTGGNKVELLKGGQTLFPALVKAIDAAERAVWMAVYLVSAIGQSGEVLEALKRAARRGVPVYLVVDGFGSHDAPALLWHELEEAGIQLAIYREAHQISIAVADDGHGFPFKGTFSLEDLLKTQTGPRTLRERVSSLGGDMLLETSEQGTRLKLTVPLAREVV